MRSPIFVWATVDQERELALITGRNHDDLVHQIAPNAPWSRAGRGWVLSLPELGDLACLCQEEHVIFRERVAK